MIRVEARPRSEGGAIFAKPVSVKESASPDVSRGTIKPPKIKKASIYRIVSSPGVLSLYVVERIDIEEDIVMAVEVVTQRDSYEMCESKKQGLEMPRR